MDNVLSLTKTIVSRKVTVTFAWCKKDFLIMSQSYRNLRAKCRNPMCSCYWCKHNFTDGEMMALAHVVGKGNKTLCQQCVSDLSISETNPPPSRARRGDEEDV